MSIFLGIIIALLFFIPTIAAIEKDSYNRAVMDCKTNKPICEATYQSIVADEKLEEIKEK